MRRAKFLHRAGQTNYSLVPLFRPAGHKKYPDVPDLTRTCSTGRICNTYIADHLHHYAPHSASRATMSSQIRYASSLTGRVRFRSNTDREFIRLKILVKARHRWISETRFLCCTVPWSRLQRYLGLRESNSYVKTSAVGTVRLASDGSIPVR